MGSIFDKLMLARQLSFTEGKIELLRQRVVFFPSDFFGLYTLEVSKNLELVKMLYTAIKQDAINGFGAHVHREYANPLADYSKLIKDIAVLSGWGKIKFADLNEEEKSALITIEDTPVGSYLKNRVSTPCDHVLRGLVAGNGTVAFGKDVDAIETECIAIGDEKCKIVINSKDKLKSKFPSLFKLQIADKRE